MAKIIDFPNYGPSDLGLLQADPNFATDTGDTDIDYHRMNYMAELDSALDSIIEALKEAHGLGYRDPALENLAAALKAVFTPRALSPVLPLALQLDLFSDYDHIAIWRCGHGPMRLTDPWSAKDDA
jgi:hypothetical protein